jgi:uncharacterized membrane protein
MKKYFTTGVAILLPIILTVVIVEFLVNFLTKPFLEPTKALITQFGFFQHPFLLIHETALVTIASKILILLFLAGFIALIGFLGKLFLIDYLFRVGDYFLHKLPYVNKIYKACQDIVHSLFSSQKTFSQVALVPFPNAHNLSVGLVIGDPIMLKQIPHESLDLISVFVPCTPNPSVGFMLMFKREQLTFVNMKVDEAMKFVLSCAVVMPDFATSQPFYQTTWKINPQ